MADAATQALSFTMAAYGFTIDRDGWRFEPVPDETARFVCRGQVTPDSAHILDYEVFVEEIIDGPTPTVFAALLCRSDGFRVFHCRRFGLRLVPDWPVPSEVPGPARTVGNSRDVRGDRGALLASARGRLSDAFGVLYAPFDGARRAPRFPGEPYHFVSRIVSVDGAPGTPVKGGAAVTEYDVPADAWYFADANSAAVPLSALIEILLQPCGWLGSYMGFAANRADDVIFRNLDGAEVVLHKKAGVGVLRVTSRLERFVESGWSTIVFFDVVCTQGDDLVMSMKPAFGFFSPAALETQVGLPAGPEVVAGLSAAAPVSLPYEADGLSGAPWLGRGKLQLIDRVHFWPGGGQAVWDGSSRRPTLIPRRGSSRPISSKIRCSPVPSAWRPYNRRLARRLGSRDWQTATDSSSNPSLWASRSAGSYAAKCCRPTREPEPKSKSFPRQEMTAVS